jgi:hypothetical protein
MAGIFDNLFKKQPTVNTPAGLLGGSPTPMGDPSQMAQQILSRSVGNMTPTIERDPNPVARMTDGIMARTPAIGVGAPERQAPTSMGQQRGILGKVADVATGSVPQTLLASPDRLNALAQALGKTTATPMSTAQRLSTGLLAGSAAEKENEKALRAAELAGLKKGEERQKTFFTQEGSLRKDYQAESKKFKNATNAYAKLRANAEIKDPKGSDDVALIFNFMKTLDPESTVRESEYATAKDTAGLPSWVRNTFNKALSGQFLTDSQRAFFLQTAEDAYFAQQRTQKENEDYFRKLASSYDLDSENIVTPFSGSFKRKTDPRATYNEKEIGVLLSTNAGESADNRLYGITADEAQARADATGKQIFFVNKFNQDLYATPNKR